MRKPFTAIKKQQFINQLYKAMIFSNFNIDLLTKEKKLCKHEILKALFEKNAIEKIKKETRGEGFGAHNRLCEKLDAFFLNDDSLAPHGFSEKHIQYNIAYVLPSLFLKHSPLLYLQEIDDNKFKILLTRKPILYFLVSKLNKEKDPALSSKKIFLILLANKALGEPLPPLEETRLLAGSEEILTKKTDENTELVTLAIKTRRISINRKNNNTVDSNNKIALFISGQLRGYEEALPSIAARIADLSMFDIYVSTWNEVGSTQITPERISRLFDSDAVDWIEANSKIDQLDKVQSSEFRKTNKKSLTEQLSSIFPGASLKVNIKDDSEYPYNIMTNPEKMYFHNAYWVKTLGDDFFINNYKKIIKVRPDLYFQEQEARFDDLINDTGQAIYSENNTGWIYREWGFGMGDQLIYGNTFDMLKIMSLHSEGSLSKKLTALTTYSNSKYQGHINCGFETWLTGKECHITKIKPTKICTANKFNLEETKELFNQIKVDI